MFEPMRGKDIQQSAMFSYVSPEERVPADHPLRPIRTIGGRGLERTVPIVRATIRGLGSSLDRAGEAVARAATARGRLEKVILSRVLPEIRGNSVLCKSVRD
jgi:hypothetical protein